MYRQDMPRAGGFPTVRYRMDLPPRGISGWGMFAVGAVVMGAGLAVLGMGNKHRRYVLCLEGGREGENAKKECSKGR